jgi:uncharacterized membrane protein
LKMVFICSFLCLPLPSLTFFFLFPFHLQLESTNKEQSPAAQRRCRTQKSVQSPGLFPFLTLLALLFLPLSHSSFLLFFSSSFFSSLVAHRLCRRAWNSQGLSWRCLFPENH